MAGPRTKGSRHAACCAQRVKLAGCRRGLSTAVACALSCACSNATSLFEQEGIHPVLAAALPSDALGGLEAQSDLAEIAAKLKSYRPSQTVFEAEVAAARKGSGAGGWRDWQHGWGLGGQVLGANNAAAHWRWQQAG